MELPYRQKLILLSGAECAMMPIIIKTYTVIAYDIPAGGHHVEAIMAKDATHAALQLRTKLGLSMPDLEIVGVVPGPVIFETIDPQRVALAPFSPASP